jgi:hypothetical protein
MPLAPVVPALVVCPPVELAPPAPSVFWTVQPQKVAQSTTNDISVKKLRVLIREYSPCTPIKSAKRKRATLAPRGRAPRASYLRLWTPPTWRIASSSKRFS